MSRTERSIQNSAPMTREGPVVYVADAPGLVYECRGSATPARFQGARPALPMTSMQVECGKSTKRPSHHTHAGTRETLISVLHVVSVPQYGRRSMMSVAIIAPSRPSLRFPTLRDLQLNVDLYTYRSQQIWQIHQCSVCWKLYFNLGTSLASSSCCPQR